MTNLPTNLPGISKAKLPVLYQQAKDQLAECARIDECKDWADKAQALASYAKQSDDEALEKLARRIRARAIKRCGQLLKQFDARGGDRSKSTTSGTSARPLQKRMAAQAGMSKRQKDTALRVAEVDDSEFEAAVESDNPPTAMTLAKRGTKKRLIDLQGRDPEEFKIATRVQGEINSFAKLAEAVNPSVVIRGSFENELTMMLKAARKSNQWLERLITQLERKIEND